MQHKTCHCTGCFIALDAITRLVNNYAITR